MKCGRNKGQIGTMETRYVNLKLLPSSNFMPSPSETYMDRGEMMEVVKKNYVFEIGGIFNKSSPTCFVSGIFQHNMQL